MTSIDEVIFLIEFIDNIKKPEQKLEELLSKLDQAKIRKDFIDDLFIALEETDFLKYLNLLTYPKNLLKFLEKRRNELENRRSTLSKMMDHDIKLINTTITVSIVLYSIFTLNLVNFAHWALRMSIINPSL